nr:nesprin-2-like [Pseudochaenichthys georgianus]
MSHSAESTFVLEFPRAPPLPAAVAGPRREPALRGGHQRTHTHLWQPLQQHRNTLAALQAELQARQAQQLELQALWAQLQPEEEEEEESREAQEKLHVTGSKLKLLLRQVEQDLSTLPPQLGRESAPEAQGQSSSADPKKGSSPKRERRDSSPPRSSFFYRVLRAAFPLHLLFLFLLLLPCIIPWSESEPGCTAANNFARSFYPMLKYTNGPPPHLTTHLSVTLKPLNKRVQIM